MSALSIPNSIANGIAADGNNVDANFDAIKSWADTHVVEKSGATFTGDVVLAGPPTLAGGAATKAYVDAVTVNTANLAAGAVTSAKIADGTIVNGDLASGKFTNVRGIQASDYCFRAIRSGSGGIANATSSIVVFDSEQYDYGADYNTTNGHYTVPEAGVYHFDATLSWDTGSLGYRLAEIRRYNSGGTFQELIGQAVVSAGDVGTDYTVNAVAGDALCAANDIIRVHVYQTSGASLDIVANATNGCFFSGHCVRLS